MTKDQIIRTIAGMRDRENVQEIREAADQRDLALMEHESYRISKKVFSRFEGLKRGDSVFVHSTKLDRKQQWLAGRPLLVWAVHPKNRSIEVRTVEFEEVKVKTGKKMQRTINGKTQMVDIMRTEMRQLSYLLRWSVLEKLKVSTKPTPEALAYVLKGGKS